MELMGTGQVIQSAMNVLMGVIEALEEKDIGTIIGEPTAQFVRNKTVPSIQLTLFWSTSKEPPHWKPQPDGKVIRPYTTIPNVRRSAMNYETIRSAMGGNNGFLWGRFWCSAALENGGKIKCFAGTENEAKQRVKAFLELSDSKMLGMYSGEELDEGTRTREQNAFKDTIRCYPHSLGVVNTKKIFLNERKGRTQLDGRFDRKYANKIPMWWPTKPSFFDETMKEMLRKTG